jgi:hypothetical protein
MSQNSRHTDLREKTQQLLQGSLRHVRAATLAAALVPLATVAVSQAVAQDCGSAGCPPPEPPSGSPTATVPSPCDFTTSGGFVFSESGRVNFGVHGGCKHGAFWGHVNVNDHQNDYHLESTAITGYLTPVPGSNVRDICGWGRTNRDPEPVRFRVRLVDEGEPGTNDRFGIVVWSSTDYTVTTRLLGATGPGGGNVQLHEPNRSTTEPSPAPDEEEMCEGVPAPE